MESSSSSGMITRRRSVDDDEGISPKDVSLLSPLASPTLSMEEGGGDNINNNAYEPPGKTRRRRSNTFHGESPSKESPNAQVSLQPVNFGEGHTAVQFSPGSTGSGGETGTTRSRGLSSSFTAGMGSHTLSSGSLYSELSETGSHSPEGGIGSLDGLLGGTTYQPGFTAMKTSSSAGTMDKRQKRLERNRESARASRKRRKAYLEELELKVNRMSEEMDKGRREHASMAIQTIRNMRLEKLHEVEQMLEGKPAAGSRSGIQHNVTSQMPSLNSSSLEEQIQPLMSNLSRTSDELQIVQTFMKQQLMSLVQPTEIKYLLWLSLQNDQLFRGGRSPSERLSAARIGERLLHSGTTKATPSTGMWPLTCHEIGLSYDQEERIRAVQRSVLANPETWVHRHTALATRNVLESIHDVLGEAQIAANRRENSLMNILTPEQRIKFMAWASKNGDRLKNLMENHAAETRASVSATSREECGEDEYKTSPDRHVAANLYIVDHLLSKVKKRQQQCSLGAPITVHPRRLKKLARRPSLETIGELEGGTTDSEAKKMSRETSFPSTGSLKRSLNALNSDQSSAEGMVESVSNNSLSNVTPESAEGAGLSAIKAVLHDVLKIIPEYAYPSSTSGALPMAVLSSQPQDGKPKSKYKPRRKSSNKQAAAAAATNDDIDIPMPTPVSVLMQTADDFITEPLYGEGEPLDAEQYADYGASPDDYLPEQVTSHVLLNNRHASAPQLYSRPLGGATSPPQDFSYPSLLPQATQMSAIPESSGVTNPMMMPPPPRTNSGGYDVLGDMSLEDLLGDDDFDIGLDLMDD